MVLNKIACTEVFEILSYMNRETVMKIPFEILSIIKENRNVNYVSKIDKNDMFNPNNLSEDAISILSWLDLEYLASNESKEEKLKIYQENEELYQQKLKEKYNADKIFKNYEQYDYKLNDEMCNEQNNKMIKYKNNIFFRIYKKIYTLLFKR